MVISPVITLCQTGSPVPKIVYAPVVAIETTYSNPKNIIINVLKTFEVFLFELSSTTNINP